MITLKSEREMAIMDRCNTLVLQVLAELTPMVRPGCDVADLDAYAEERTRGEGAEPSFKGYHGFPSALCVSINEQVVHGIPVPRKLVKGDIVSIDFGVHLDGFHGDGAQTIIVGEASPEVAALVHGTREALRLGIAQMRPGNCLGDIGHAVQSHAEENSWGVVQEYVGHGIGRELHESPSLPNFGEPGRGTRLVEGMVLAIEPMLNLGTAEVKLGGDEWTVSTADGKPSAHFERSVAITAAGPWVLGSGAAPGEALVDLPDVQMAATASQGAEMGGSL
jgi:methionyl aminopeptidase